MIDPTDMASIMAEAEKHFAERHHMMLNRILELEARVFAHRGTLSLPLNKPEPPVVVVPGKPNAPPHS